jgi:hypothetical protein
VHHNPKDPVRPNDHGYTTIPPKTIKKTVLQACNNENFHDVGASISPGA